MIESIQVFFFNIYFELKISLIKILLIYFEFYPKFLFFKFNLTAVKI